MTGSDFIQFAATRRRNGAPQTNVVRPEAPVTSSPALLAVAGAGPLPSREASAEHIERTAAPPAESKVLEKQERQALDVAEPSSSLQWRVSNFGPGVSESDAVTAVRDCLQRCRTVLINGQEGRLSKAGKPVVVVSITAAVLDIPFLEAELKSRWIVERTA